MSKVIKIKGKDFNELATVANFASRDKSRPILTGVKFQTVDNTVQAVATDSYRLVLMDREIIDGEDVDVLIPAEVFLRALKSFKAVKNNYSDVTITINEDDTFTIGSNGDVLGGNLITGGAYPGVMHLVPSDGISETESVGLNAQFLAEFAKLAPFNSKDSKENTILIKAIKDNARPIKFTDKSGRSVAVLMPVRCW